MRQRKILGTVSYSQAERREKIAERKKLLEEKADVEAHLRSIRKELEWVIRNNRPQTSVHFYESMEQEHLRRLQEIDAGLEASIPLKDRSIISYLDLTRRQISHALWETAPHPLKSLIRGATHPISTIRRRKFRRQLDAVVPLTTEENLPDIATNPPENTSEETAA